MLLAGCSFINRGAVSTSPTGARSCSLISPLLDTVIGGAALIAGGYIFLKGPGNRDGDNPGKTDMESGALAFPGLVGVVSAAYGFRSYNDCTEELHR